MPLGGLLALVLTAAGPADWPVAWSPDGEWLAYTVRVPSDGPGLPERWLFDAGNMADESNEPDDQDQAYRLWATRTESMDSVLLDAGRGYIGAPCWGPVGRVLAYCRIVSEAGVGARYEVVVQDELDRQRVILSRPVLGGRSRWETLGPLTPAWSPDGRLLAVPLPQQTLDLAVVRADNGGVLKVFADAEAPAWSPDAKNVALAFVRGRDKPALQWVDAALGAPRTLLELGRAAGPPTWLDAGALAIVASTTGRKGIASGAAFLLRVSVENGATQQIVPLSANVAEPGEKARPGSFSFDRDRDNLFLTTIAALPPYEIFWCRPRNQETYKRFAPYDITVASGALAVAPTDRRLAFRAGRSGAAALPALLDLDDERLVPSALVPDDDVRVEWLVTLVRAARRLLFAGMPPAKLKAGGEAERPTALPLPGEIAPRQELLVRLRRLARSGRRICDRPLGAPLASPALRDLLDQARLFFDYLGQDYDAALASLDALEPRISDPELRLRLLSVRAQIHVAQGRAEEARETIQYLRQWGQRQAGAVEDTPLGLEVRAERVPKAIWAEYLSERSEAYLRAIRRPGPDDENEHNPFGNLNLDAAEEGLFGGEIEMRRPRRFPFGPARPAPRFDGRPDIVLPPGAGMDPPPPRPVAPAPGGER